jgi:hypothetical protein
MDMLFAICAGIGLAAACGLRVFLPLLGLSAAAAFGFIDPPAGMKWLDSATAVFVFGVATAVEVAAYYIPWLDHLLDTITTPGSVVAGTIAVAAMMPDLHPSVRWSLALVAGGGAAGLVQTGTVLTRAVSGATTGGIGNPVVSTVELIGSILLTILALLLPIIAALLVILLIVWTIRAIVRWRQACARRKLTAPAPSPSSDVAV